jgi:hypothetical protein
MNIINPSDLLNLTVEELDELFVETELWLECITAATRVVRFGCDDNRYRLPRFISAAKRLEEARGRK